MSRSSCPKKSPIKLAPTKLREIVNEVQRLSQAPIEVVMLEVIATCLASVQHKIKWGVSGWPTLPVGVFFIAVGEPSIGKGLAASIGGSGICQYDIRVQSGSQIRDVDFQIAKDDWEEELDEIKKERRVLKKNKKDLAEIDERRRNHYLAVPEPPPDQRLLRSDVSELALAQDLGHPSVYVNLTEGGRFLTEVLPHQVRTYNSAYSGEALSAGRLHLSIHANDPRLTLFIAVQPAKMKLAFKKSFDDYDGTGFLNRVILTAPLPGAVNIDEQSMTSRTSVLDEFNATVLRHLESRFSDVHDTVLQFSPSALEKYFELRRRIEVDVVEARPLSQLRGAARRIAENVGRIANGLSGFFEGPDSSTTCDYFDFAQALVLSHFIERQQLFSKNGPLTSVAEDAELLLTFLKDKQRDPIFFDGNGFASRIKLRHRRQFRGKGGIERLDDAIEKLRSEQHIEIAWSGNRYGAQPGSVRLIDQRALSQPRFDLAEMQAPATYFRDYSYRREIRCTCLRCSYEI